MRWAGGALLAGGLLWALFGRKGPKVGVVIVSRSGDYANWPGDTRAQLRAMAPDFVSVKLQNGTSRYRQAEQLELVRELRSDGHTIHGWGYHYSTSEADARAEAKLTAAICSELQIADWHWDAEKEWSRSNRPDLSGIAYASELAARAPGVTRWANCVSSGKTQAMLRAWHYWEPMCYGGDQGSRATLKWQFERVLMPYSGSKGRAVMLATGRITPASPAEPEWAQTGSNIWGGRWYDGGGQPGARSLVRAFAPKAVSFYRAPLNFSGNAHNPPVSVQVAELKGLDTGVT